MNELTRIALEMVTNGERLERWRERYEEATGYQPDCLAHDMQRALHAWPRNGTTGIRYPVPFTRLLSLRPSRNSAPWRQALEERYWRERDAQVGL